MESLNPKVRDAVISGMVSAMPLLKEISVGDVTPLCQGWESEIHAVDAKGRLGGGEVERALVLRVYQGADASAKAAREFRGMRRLWEMGYPVPEVFFVETSPDVIGRPFMAMERIDGRPLSHVFSDSDSAMRSHITSLYLKTLVKLHTLDWAEFDPSAGGVDTESPYGCIDASLAQIDGLLDWMDAGQLRPIFDWFRERRELVPSRRVSVLHGDYHGMNILMEASGALKVLDWSQLRVGDARADLAWTLILSGAEGNPERRDELIAQYESILGEKLEQMWYFEGMAAAFRLAVAWVSLRSGSEALGMHEDAVNAMRQGINHYRAVYETFVNSTHVESPEFRGLLAGLAS